MLRAKGQSDESQIIAGLTQGSPRTFVEFGFHPIEFNCISLAKDPQWRGLLIDGNRSQVEDARSLFSDRIKIVEGFLTLNNLDFIKSSFPKLGILSVDVDGNDYWFPKSLIEVEPPLFAWNIIRPLAWSRLPFLTIPHSTDTKNIRRVGITVPRSPRYRSYAPSTVMVLLRFRAQAAMLFSQKPVVSIPRQRGSQMLFASNFPVLPTISNGKQSNTYLFIAFNWSSRLTGRPSH